MAVFVEIFLLFLCKNQIETPLVCVSSLSRIGTSSTRYALKDPLSPHQYHSSRDAVRSLSFSSLVTRYTPVTPLTHF